MAYQGVVARIPLGQIALYTDDDPMKTPPGSLIRANNVQLRHNFIEKDAGSTRYNQSALPAAITGIQDWWPTDEDQRGIAVCANGKVYQITHNGYKNSEVLYAGISGIDTEVQSTTLNLSQPYFATGGAEETNKPRKLFIFTGRNPVQVISGQSDTRYNMQLPAADWPNNTIGEKNPTTQYPTHGVIHRGRLFIAFGHRLYASSIEDHEDFQTIGDFFQVIVYPGEGEKIQGLFVWKSRLYIMKYPQGLYYLDDTASGTSDWGIRKLSSSFGGGSVQCSAAALDDFLVGNETGLVSSMRAVQAFGGVEVGSLLKMLRCEEFVRNTVRNTQDRQALYYADRKTVLFTYRSTSGTQLDRILKIDYNQQDQPRVSWSDKDQPNCLASMKDINRVERPVYGANDGYVYKMDQVDRSVGGAPFLMDFQTSYMDMSHINPHYGDMNKVFDHLQVTFSPTGLFNLTVDVYIDDNFIETIQFPVAQATANLLGDKTAPTAVDMVLGDKLAPTRTDGVLEGEVTYSLLKPLHGLGKRISLRCYNNGLRETIRISALSVYFRPAGQEAQKE